MTIEDLEDELEKILQKLKRDADVRLVLLFGSMARGEAREGSDIDLIIVKRTDKRFLDRLDEFYDEIGEPRDVLVYTPEEFEEMRARPFIQRALKEGKILYEAGRDDVT